MNKKCNYGLVVSEQSPATLRAPKSSYDFYAFGVALSQTDFDQTVARGQLQ